MNDLVVLDRPEEGIALVTLNRPDKTNALSIAPREVLLRTKAKFQRRAGVARGATLEL